MNGKGSLNQWSNIFVDTMQHVFFYFHLATDGSIQECAATCIDFSLIHAWHTDNIVNVTSFTSEIYKLLGLCDCIKMMFILFNVCRINYTSQAILCY